MGRWRSGWGGRWEETLQAEVKDLRDQEETREGLGGRAGRWGPHKCTRPCGAIPSNPTTRQVPSGTPGPTRLRGGPHQARPQAGEVALGASSGGSCIRSEVLSRSLLPILSPSFGFRASS